MAEKRALVVGVNYAGQNCELTGCAADAIALADFLTARGYEVRRLIDSQDEAEATAQADPTGRGAPTRANILGALLDLIVSGAPHLFFSFAGHGTRQLDESGDETDGRDEVLCPVDLDKGMITDDAVRGVLQCLQPHQRLVCVLDCCHSGTGMDLKYELYDRGGTSFRFIAAAGGAPTPAPVVLLSGCRDEQTSAESAVRQKAADGSDKWATRGALTAALVPVLEAHPRGISCANLLGSVRASLKQGGFDQVAQLSAGRECSPQTLFL